MKRIFTGVIIVIFLAGSGGFVQGGDGDTFNVPGEILECRGLYFESLPPADSAQSVEWLDNETVEFWHNLNGTSGTTRVYRVDTYRAENGGWYFLRTKMVYISESVSKEPQCRRCHEDRGKPCGAFESFRGECS